MSDTVPSIAVVQGAPDATIQALFAQLVAEWQPAHRVAGLIAESHGLAGHACSAGHLRSIASGEAFPMFQDLGQGATACHVAGDGVLMAGEAVRRDITAGCDLVVLNKFGKLEAGGRGLRDAFVAAIEAGRPVLTSVAPAFEAAWQEFASPLFVVLPADAAGIRAWWRDVSATAPPAVPA